MTERNGNQEKKFTLPPLWCGSICRNSMNEICVENCAIKRDCSAFEEKPNLKLEDMPRFPETKGMTKEEKFQSVTVYLAKVIDHLQGIEEEHNIFPVYLSPKIDSTDTKKPIVEIAPILQSFESANGKDNE